jgi:hypothetical protein
MYGGFLIVMDITYILSVFRAALRRHLEVDMGGVMEALMASLQGGGSDEERVKEAEAGCRCTESWINYGLGAESVSSSSLRLSLISV